MNFFATINFIGILFAFYLGNLVYLRDPPNKLNRIFYLNILMVVFTGLVESFRLNAPDEHWAIIWNNISCVWPFFPFIFLKFVLVLSENKLDKKSTFIYSQMNSIMV